MQVIKQNLTLEDFPAGEFTEKAKAIFDMPGLLRVHLAQKGDAAFFPAGVVVVPVSGQLEAGIVSSVAIVCPVLNMKSFEHTSPEERALVTGAISTHLGKVKAQVPWSKIVGPWASFVDSIGISPEVEEEEEKKDPDKEDGKE